MTARLTHLYRHPVKGIGHEPLAQATLTPEGALVGDRAWALLTEAADDTDAWQPRRNFLQVAHGPALAGIDARTAGDTIHLSHPHLPDIAIASAADGPALGAWLAPLWPATESPPARLVRAPGHGMTDMPDPFVSLGNLASLRALSQRAGQELDRRRFRINLWVDGLAPWEELDLIGKTLAIGPHAQLLAAEPIGRCRAPEADPETGNRDVDVCRVLHAGWGHTNFGIYLRVATAGDVTEGDGVTWS